MLVVAAARSQFCPSALMHFVFFFTMVSPGFHYSFDVAAELFAVGCPLPSFVVAVDMSPDLDERSKVCSVRFCLY